MPSINYNERSWAIDVISHINIYLSTRDKIIKYAGGENTIRNNSRSLFPDILLFADISQGEILQGWELKMPDTSTADEEFINNATIKANTLSLDSFILWNVKSAVLYVRSNEDSDKFEIFHNWDEIEIDHRENVQENDSLWKGLLENIIETLCSFFENGNLNISGVAKIISLDEIVNIILNNKEMTARELKSSAINNSHIDAKINNWWRSSSREYPSESDKYLALSKVILTDWLIKIIFGHIIKKYFDEARRIDSIDFDTSVDEAILILEKISLKCNFWNIFSPNIAQGKIPNDTWNQLIQLNTFLLDLDVAGISLDILHEILQALINNAKRKIAGQFSTPSKLSEILTRITIDDKTKSVFDPCCGTGTIISAAVNLKKEYGLSDDQIIDKIWASDKYAFPIQLATLTLSKPENLGKILKVFQKDIIDLTSGDNITFKDPNDGSNVIEIFNKIDYVVSNLPFVQQEDIKHLNPNIGEINSWIKNKVETELTLSGKSDLFAYIPFYIYDLLNNNGQIGLILSNAWLGTDYGEKFIKLLQFFYDIKHVVISANGKWIDTADVVTTLLIAKKRKKPKKELSTSNVGFHTIKNSLNEINDIKKVSDDIILCENNKTLSTISYTNQKISEINEFGLTYNSLFANVEWILNIKDKLIPVTNIFNIKRGERRGLNEMFYPNPGHNIEEDYIKPVLKNLRGDSNLGLTSKPNQDAFCCSKELVELDQLGHHGALAWIRRFETPVNKRKLQRANQKWYEMKADTMADFVSNINFAEYLFISRLEKKSFVDQRLTSFSFNKERSENDKMLIHALLNSLISMFFIEGIGFGRGLGALDLNKNKIEENYKILDPTLLSDKSKHDIVSAFKPILSRNRYKLKEELLREDRINFENVVFRCFEITKYLDPCKKSLIKLFEIRNSVN